jgi:deoxyribodipyrimidine photolyase-related protein
MKFNILKPIYHRATMKKYYDFLKDKKINVEYVPVSNDWVKMLTKKKYKNISSYDPVDLQIEDKIDDFDNWELFDSPSFLTKYDELKTYDGPLKQTSFYIWQRKRMGILLDKNKKPLSGKWTYDSENRSKLPKDFVVPDVKDFSKNEYVDEAYEYALKNFPNCRNYIDDDFELIFPIDFANSKKVLANFFNHKFKNFGKYQDAITENEKLLFHSGISGMLNIGLLTPQDVIEQALEYKNTIEMNNIEGFIRQILGWREFCRYTYCFHREKYLNKNYFNAKNKLSIDWYDGTTENVPLDVCIKKAFKNGYLHHIERLMVVANNMVLYGIHPKQMYKWFMEFSLDSYNWVMEFNIYSMASYSDGGVFTTKPYISSSNYIFKMSNYKKSTATWNDKMDDMFWDFLKTHKEKIKKINRLNMLIPGRRYL